MAGWWRFVKNFNNSGLSFRKRGGGAVKPRPKPFYTRETFFGLWGEKAADYLEISSEMLIFVEFM